MKNKKGFTLTELMVVIVIIAIIAVIAIPSIVLINKNINKRLYNQKVETIVSAAELYAQENPDIFNGKSEVKVYVAELLNANVLKIETSTGDNCTSVQVDGGQQITTSGCILDPTDKTSMNKEYVILRKDAVGVVASFNGKTLISSAETLVEIVCERLGDGTFIGKYGEGAGDYCTCAIVADSVKIFKGQDPSLTSSQAVSACLITGNNVPNYLKYDDVYWRVMGLYNLGSNVISAKMITDENIVLD